MASAMARDQGQSASGSHGRTTSGATTAATKIKTHWVCKIPRAARRRAALAAGRPRQLNPVDPINKAMPGRQGR